jgi:hypothetical protein
MRLLLTPLLTSFLVSLAGCGSVLSEPACSSTFHSASSSSSPSPNVSFSAATVFSIDTCTAGSEAGRR